MLNEAGDESLEESFSKALSFCKIFEIRAKTLCPFGQFVILPTLRTPVCCLSNAAFRKYHLQKHRVGRQADIGKSGSAKVEAELHVT